MALRKKIDDEGQGREATTTSLPALKLMLLAIIARRLRPSFLSPATAMVASNYGACFTNIGLNELPPRSNSTSPSILTLIALAKDP